MTRATLPAQPANPRPDATTSSAPTAPAATPDTAVPSTNAAPAPTYRPTEHGMVTSDFLADFLDTLDAADSDSDQEAPSATAAIPVATRVQLRQDNRHYTAKLATEAHFAEPWFADVQACWARNDMDGAVAVIGAQLAARTKDPQGPTRVKAMVDYLYLKCQYRDAMCLCRAWVDHVTRPKGPGRVADPRLTAYRDMAETGLRAAHQLRDEDAAVEFAKHLTPMDGNLSYLLGTFHQFFPSSVLGAHPRVSPQTLLGHLVMTAFVHRPNDVTAFIAMRDLLFPQPHALLSLLGRLAHVRAHSILAVAKTTSSPIARKTWERELATLAAFPLRDAPASNDRRLFNLCGFRFHDMQAATVGPYNDGDSLLVQVPMWVWRAEPVHLSETKTDLLPPWHALDPALAAALPADLAAAVPEPSGGVSDWFPKEHVQVARALFYVYADLVRGAAKSVAPVVWACNRAGVTDVPPPTGAAAEALAVVDDGDDEEEAGGAALNL
ncbi:hypothetical protein GGF32_003202 [Allomyces javanicus]|nr:hypothetical protein GGF32_003202 [Allomyces javanicus]